MRLGTVLSGTRVTPGTTSRGFSQITLQGWVFTASTRSDQREGFDLSVTATPGENVRATPGGTILARAVEGTLFNSLSRNGGWTRVRRTVWIATRLARRPDGQTASDPGSRLAIETSSRPAVLPSDQPPTRQAADTTGRRRAADPVAPPAALPTATLRSGASVQRNPDGPAIAKIAEPTDVAIRETNGEWVKVQLEGWVRRTEVDSAVTPRPSITAAMLRENPDRFVGQTVEWRIQFLALQQADDLRPEMSAGQPYLLVRGPLPESGFAYVTITRAQMAEFRSLRPLEELTLSVTVRAGRTRYLATPVVELVRRMP